MTTPNKIEHLKENQIFVFGSNLKGEHLGGAAKTALQWGAIMGQGEGLQGQTYAIPTLDDKMKKVTKVELKKSINKLYKHAKKYKNKEYLVTKVGCGIAGFKEDEIKKIFKSLEKEKPSNIVLPAGWSIVRGYKAFNKGLICRNFQYEIGKDFYHQGKIELCESGFHFCKSLRDVYYYYNYYDDIVVAEVESEGDVVDEGNKNKSVTNHLRVIRILNKEEASDNSGKLNTGHSNTGDRNTGDWNTGDSNTGYWNTGDNNTGDSNTGDSNTGYWNTGDNNTGYRNTGDNNTGDRNTGYNNTGDRNTGDWNTGDWNTSDHNNGYFNTKKVKEIMVFNKPCKKEEWDKVTKPNCLYFDVNKWVPFSQMTDEEKKEYKTSIESGGYMKKLDYKEEFKKSMERASAEEIELVKKLPNFDKDVFFEISGFMIK